MGYWLFLYIHDIGLALACNGALSLKRDECHLNFNSTPHVENWTESVTWILCVFYPPRIELWTLDEHSREKYEKECVKAVLCIVILEYTLHSKLSCCIRFIHRISLTIASLFQSNIPRIRKWSSPTRRVIAMFISACQFNQTSLAYSQKNLYLKRVYGIVYMVV